MMWLPYIKVVFVSIMHQRIWKCEFHSFFLCVYLTRQNLKGGRHRMMVVLWSNLNRWFCRFSCYSYCSASSKSHLPYSTTQGACSNMAMWYLVACCIWCLACIAPNLLNCISLVYTLYMWIWHAFLFFGTYYICLSHHVLTSNYCSCVSCIYRLWWDSHARGLVWDTLLL